MAAYFGITEDTFLTQSNIENVLTSVSVIWIIAAGMTFVLISGGLDLSVAAVAALAGLLVAKTVNSGLPIGLAIVLAILFGVLVGMLINGLLIAKFELSFFIVTLGTATAYGGILSLWSKTQSIQVVSPFLEEIAFGRILGVPVPIWIMGAIFVAALYIQHSTYFGRNVYAVGGSIVAAKLSGVRVVGTLLAVYGLVGGCAALAGVVGTARIGAASATVEFSITLNAIAAVLIGGTSLNGGSGSVTGTLFGVLFIGILQNGLSVAGVASGWQAVVTGCILVLAVLGNLISLKSLARRPRPAGGSDVPVLPEADPAGLP